MATESYSNYYQIASGSVGGPILIGTQHIFATTVSENGVVDGSVSVSIRR